MASVSQPSPASAAQLPPQAEPARLPLSSDRELRSRNKQSVVVAQALSAVGLLSHTFANSGSELRDHPLETIAWLQGHKVKANAFVSRSSSFDENGDPLNIRAAQKKDWPQWKSALLDEWQQMVDNDIFHIIPPHEIPPNTHIISSKWVFKRKPLADASIRYKGRLVISGFQQIAGVDYDLTYAPTASLVVFRMLLALAAYYSRTLRQVDCVTAFLNGEIDSDVYMHPPEDLVDILGINLPPGAILKLRKALYGLKHAPRIWWHLINSFLVSIGFHCRTDVDVNLYTKYDENGKFVAILLFVDDMLLIGDRAPIEDTFHMLSSSFKLNDLGTPSLFFGIHIEHRNGSIFIHQERYINHILSRFQMQDASPGVHPCPPDTRCNMMGTVSEKYAQLNKLQRIPKPRRTINAYDDKPHEIVAMAVKSEINIVGGGSYTKPYPELMVCIYVYFLISTCLVRKQIIV